jgi:hypothetical protein
MKARGYLVIAAFIGCLIESNRSCAENENRLFANREGRVIKGRLVDYNALKQIATIRRDDNAIFDVPVMFLSEADQQYILNQAMRDAIRIQAELRTFETEVKCPDGRYSPEHIKCKGYTIVLQNHWNTTFEAVDIKYCIFYRQGEREPGGIVYKDGVKYGCLKVDSLRPCSRRNLNTATVLICNNAQSTILGTSGTTKGMVQGIWIRAVATLPDGEKITRELRLPEDVIKSKNWTTRSVLVGLN